jgi:3-hydroxyisobutyrate dehydrogenase
MSTALQAVTLVHMKVAVLGMGRMGRAVATRLLGGGHRLTVWNRSAGRAGDVVSAGGREATTIADAVSGADVVISILANDDAVRAVAFEQLRPVIGARTVFVDSSTVSPALSSELAASFPRFVALPLIGNPEAVTAGRAVLLAGGAGDLIETLVPVLSSLSGTVRRYPTAQLALTAKLTNNLLLMSEVAALAETFAVGRAGGLSDDQLRELLVSNPLVPAGLRNRFEGILTGAQHGWWTTVLGAKDVGLAIEIAQGAGVALPLAELVRRLYDRAAASGDDEADIVAITNLYTLAATPQPG